MQAGALVGYSFVQENKSRKSARRSWAALVVAPPLLRIALAVPFFKSGLTKWDGFLSLSPSAAYLFEEEFKLHIFGEAYDLPVPLAVAHLTGLAEITLPILLVLGLATRFAALGLLIMTAVIQLVVPDGWANFHLPWAALAVARPSDRLAPSPSDTAKSRVMSVRCTREVPTFSQWAPRSYLHAEVVVK